RFYYAATRAEHGHRLPDGREDDGAQAACGIGYAACPPDRLIGVRAEGEGWVLTRPFTTATPELWLNAACAPGGEVRVAVETLEGAALPGYGLEACLPLTGDAVRHRLAWRGHPDPAALLGREIRLRVRVREATLFALMAGTEAEVRAYWRFDIPGYLSLAQQARVWTP
ncbi:MAG: hypothetical protein JXA74_12475, partial [Anaerolineae bacterium]|nr:hypothetical protein [Anaerolineae bacterium]